ncbi:hypothetical protein DMJ13_18435 [halophilic archaeon]|nr:hypothetical protein DMJ13_18435 [halophilic archaeon]
MSPENNTISLKTRSLSRDVSRLFSRVLRTPVRFQTYRNLLYLVVMFPLGVFYFNLLLAGSLAGIGLVVVGIGIPLLILLFVLAVELAGFERVLVRRLLGVDIPTPPAETDGSLWSRTWRLVTAIQTWKAIVYLLSEFAYGSIVFGFLASGIATSVSFLLAPFYYTQAPVAAYGPLPPSEFTLDVLFGWDNLLIGLTRTFQIGSWQIETLLGALLVAGLGVFLLFATFLFSNTAAQLWGRYARLMLTTPRYWTLPN